MDLVRSDISYDRAAIMALAHLEYRAAGGGKAFAACLSYAWAQAKRERAAIARGVVDERLRAMRANRLAFQRERLAAPASLRAMMQ